MGVWAGLVAPACRPLCMLALRVPAGSFWGGGVGVPDLCRGGARGFWAQ